jgi:hypothetical protein
MVDSKPQRIHEILKDPTQVVVDDLGTIQDYLNEYPYFQALRAVQLKLLKDQSSSSYNLELKRTAAHTTDRGVLFDFNTSDRFLENAGLNVNDQFLETEDDDSATKKEGDKPIEDLNAASDFTKVTEKDLFLKKQKNPDLITAPFEFTEKESHSFSEWLRLTSLNPIEEKNSAEEDSDPISLDERTKRMQKIDEFLESQPKIKPSTEKIPIIDLTFQQVPDNQLMTETLARVYVVQKNYAKAIKAYEIMALQHPEKSGFFADRIREVKELQTNQ